MNPPIAPEQKVRRHKESGEKAIENAIMERPDILGFPGANTIRNFRLAQESGAVDVVLFPQEGSIRLVLIEAKVANAADANSKVIGQLLMYYCGALTMGSDGVELLQEFARNYPKEAHSIPRTSPQKVLLSVLGKRLANPIAMDRLKKGTPLTPKEIALFIAVDNKPHHTLLPVLKMLRKEHDIRIGLILVRNGMPERIDQE